MSSPSPSKPQSKTRRTYGRGYHDAGGKGASPAQRASTAIRAADSAKIPSIVLPTGANAVPTGGGSWGGYWTIITAMALTMLVLYLAANGLLRQWLDLFVFSAPATVQPAGAGTSGTTGAGSGAAGASTPSAGTQAAASAATALQQGNPLGAVTSIGRYMLNPFQW